MKNTKRKPLGYWTKSRCRVESLNYSSRREFYKKSGSAYTAARKNKWLNEISKHMNTKRRKPAGYWTLERCQKEALLYKTRIDFSKQSSASYSAAHKKGFIDEICAHMQVMGDRYRRAIYAFEFDDNSVYVGLTFNYQKRYFDHLRTGPVSRKLKYYSAKFIQFNIWYDSKTAQIKEKEKIQYYRKRSWQILNKQKPGGLGGIEIIWTIENCRKEAKKYKSKSELQNNAIGCYSSALKKGWLDNICSHMKELKKPNGYWTYQRCKAHALKYKSRVEFSEKSASAYTTSKTKNWLDRVCEHMKNKKQKPKNYWTKEMCRSEARKYKSRTEFYKNASRAYVVSKEKVWLDIFFTHVKKNKKIAKA
jgi:predicted GIY-YIG superfamily endonuclease